MSKEKRERTEDIDPEVRLTAVMKRSVRTRLRLIALRLGENLEDMAARWLEERLAAEEKRAAK